MARPRDHQKHVTEAVATLLQSVTTLVQAVASTTGGGGNASGNNRAPKKRGPGKGNPKLKAKLKAYWASMTPAQRRARTEKMRAGRTK
jgi:hypothetical protein